MTKPVSETFTPKAELSAAPCKLPKLHLFNAHSLCLAVVPQQLPITAGLPGKLELYPYLSLNLLIYARYSRASCGNCAAAKQVFI